MSAWSYGSSLAPLWIGVSGPDCRLSVVTGPSPGRSPHYWIGSGLPVGRPFDFELALHGDMGPGSVLWRDADDTFWTSLEMASAWEPERIDWPAHWSIGQGKSCADDCPFTGAVLVADYCMSQPPLINANLAYRLGKTC